MAIGTGAFVGTMVIDCDGKSQIEFEDSEETGEWITGIEEFPLINQTISTFPIFNITGQCLIGTSTGDYIHHVTDHPTTANVYIIKDTPWDDKSRNKVYMYARVAMKLTVPFLMVIFLIKEKREILLQLRVMASMRKEKQIVKKDSQPESPNNKSVKKNGKDKPTPKVQVPGRQQLRRGRNRKRRQFQTI